MTYYKILKRTEVVIFKRLWTGETKRVNTKRDAYFTAMDVYDFGKHGPEGMMYFILPKNAKKILAIGVESQFIMSVNFR